MSVVHSLTKQWYDVVQPLTKQWYECCPPAHKVMVKKASTACRNCQENSVKLKKSRKNKKKTQAHTLNMLQTNHIFTQTTHSLMDMNTNPLGLRLQSNNSYFKNIAEMLTTYIFQV